MNRYNESQYARRLLYRNKHHYNILEIDSTDRFQQVLNRIPNTSSSDASNLQFTLYKTGSMRRTRSSSKANSSQQKIRGVSMDLTLPRRDFVEVEKGPNTERNFNNFYITKPNLANTADISKRLGRTLRVNQMGERANEEEPDHDSRKHYERFYYRKSMDCRFDYSKSREEGRMFDTAKRVQDTPESSVPVERLLKALDKTRVSSQSPHNFSRFLGKQKPSSFDIRLLKSNENYWLAEPKPTTTRLRSTKPMFKDAAPCQVPRGEVCEQIYFRRRK